MQAVWMVWNTRSTFQLLYYVAYHTRASWSSPLLEQNMDDSNTMLQLPSSFEWDKLSARYIQETMVQTVLSCYKAIC